MNSGQVDPGMEQLSPHVPRWYLPAKQESRMATCESVPGCRESRDILPKQEEEIYWALTIQVDDDKLKEAVSQAIALHVTRLRPL